MKKVITFVAFLLSIACVAAITIVILCGFNYTPLGVAYNFDEAIIALPNGVNIIGEVDSWMCWEDEHLIQVEVDGTTYLTHSSNVVLLSR